VRPSSDAEGIGGENDLANACLASFVECGSSVGTGSSLVPAKKGHPLAIQNIRAAVLRS
jgi:hypothetical protein